MPPLLPIEIAATQPPPQQVTPVDHGCLPVDFSGQCLISPLLSFLHGLFLHTSERRNDRSEPLPRRCVPDPVTTTLMARGLLLSILLGSVRRLHQNWHTIPYTQFVSSLYRSIIATTSTSCIEPGEHVWHTIDLGSHSCHLWRRFRWRWYVGFCKQIILLWKYMNLRFFVWTVPPGGQRKRHSFSMSQVELDIPILPL
jgi:hypothetical protein